MVWAALRPASAQPARENRGRYGDQLQQRQRQDPERHLISLAQCQRREEDSTHDPIVHEIVGEQELGDVAIMAPGADRRQDALPSIVVATSQIPLKEVLLKLAKASL